VTALEFLKEHASAVDCILLDLVMPRLHGDAVCRELKSLAPDMRVVVMSGYLDRVTEDVAAFATTVLSKPFTPQSLRDAVRTAIGGRR
jgi:CheY-like chemotaxis protein